MRSPPVVSTPLLTFGILLVFSALFPASPLRAELFVYKNFTIVTRDEPWFKDGTLGAFPLKFRISNSAEKGILPLEIEFYNNNAVRRSIPLGAGQSTDIECPIPFFLGRSRELTLGEGSGRITVPFHQLNPNNYNKKNNCLFIGVSPNLKGVKAYNDFFRSDYNVPKIEALQVEGRELPESFACYFSVDLVFCPLSEWRSLPPLQRSHLENWTAKGGAMIFLDADSKQLEEDNPTPLIGHFKGMSPPAPESSRTPLGSRKFVYGKVFYTPQEELGESKEQWESFFKSVFHEEIAHPHFPISIPAQKLLAGHLTRVPTLTFLFVLTLFVLAIGPLNLYFLNKWGKLVLFPLTIPVIAFSTNIILTLYAIKSEGLEHKGVRQEILFIDNLSQRIFQHRVLEIYLSGWDNPTFQYPENTLIEPFENPRLEKKSNQYSAPLQNAVLNFSQGQTLGNGWIPSRQDIPLHTFSMRGGPEKIAVSRKGDSWTITNELGVPLKQLYVGLPLESEKDLGGNPKRKKISQYRWKVLSRPIAPGETLDWEKFEDSSEDHLSGTTQYYATSLIHNNNFLASRSGAYVAIPADLTPSSLFPIETDRMVILSQQSAICGLF